MEIFRDGQRNSRPPLPSKIIRRAELSVTFLDNRLLPLSQSFFFSNIFFIIFTLLRFVLRLHRTERFGDRSVGQGAASGRAKGFVDLLQDTGSWQNLHICWSVN